MKNYFAMALFLLTMSCFASANDQPFRTNRTKISNVQDVLSVGRPSLHVDHHNLGRAWLKVGVNYDDIDDVYTSSVRLKIPGLIYDTVNGEVLFNAENVAKSVVCATVTKQVRRGLFGGRKEIIKVRQTGRCVFTAKVVKETILVDDGFDLVEKTQGYVSVSVDTF